MHTRVWERGRERTSVQENGQKYWQEVFWESGRVCKWGAVKRITQQKEIACFIEKNTCAYVLKGEGATEVSRSAEEAGKKKVSNKHLRLIQELHLSFVLCHHLENK